MVTPFVLPGRQTPSSLEHRLEISADDDCISSTGRGTLIIDRRNAIRHTKNKRLTKR